MKKSKTQADPGRSRIKDSPASAPAVDRKRPAGKRPAGGPRKPRVAKKEVGRGGGKALH